MKNIRAYAIRDTSHAHQGAARGAVCILLNEAHAVHTLRTFMRGRDKQDVLEPIPAAEASLLLDSASDEETSSRLIR